MSLPVVAGFEATGNYHRPLAFRLLKANFTLRLVSSVALARTREALHNSWDKNDPKDAQVILHMLKIGATQTYCDPVLAGINVSVRSGLQHVRLDGIGFRRRRSLWLDARGSTAGVLRGD